MGSKSWKLGALAGVIGGWFLWQRILGEKEGRFDGGGTAVVTGASSGIGAAFARQLATRGYNLVLVARREERLKELAAGLERRHGIQARPHAADLAKPAEVEKLAQELGRLDDLALLVNSAGFGVTTPLVESEPQKQLDLLHLNVNAVMRLSQAALPVMIKRGGGGIINVSSIASFLTPAGSVNYCASKAYMNAFSAGLQKEVAAKGIHVQSLCPGYVTTEFHDTREYQSFDRAKLPAFLWMSADEVAARSLDALGNGEVVYIPGAQNRLIVTAARGGLMGMIEKVRQRFISSR